MRFTWPPRQASADPAPKPTSDAPSGSRGPYWDSSESDLLYCSKEIKSQYSSARMSHSCSDLRRTASSDFVASAMCMGLCMARLLTSGRTAIFKIRHSR